MYSTLLRLESGCTGTPPAARSDHATVRVGAFKVGQSTSLHEHKQACMSTISLSATQLKLHTQQLLNTDKFTSLETLIGS
jgi:hypothetical protein